MTSKCFKKEEDEIIELCSSSDGTVQNMGKLIVYALLLIARCINEKGDSHRLGKLRQLGPQ